MSSYSKVVMLDDKKKDIFDYIMEQPFLRLFYKPYEKYKPILLYIFFGGLTTIISIGSYICFDVLLNINELIANVFSWLLAVFFAYLTNRTWVFASNARGIQIVKEIISFFAGRLLTLGLEEMLILVFVTILAFNSILIKILGQIAVLILNYIISKVFVFRKKEPKCER